MDKKKYLRINNYTQVKWYMIVLTVVCLYYGYTGIASSYWWIPALITGLAAILTHTLGSNAYERYMETQKLNSARKTKVIVADFEAYGSAGQMVQIPKIEGILNGDMVALTPPGFPSSACRVVKTEDGWFLVPLTAYKKVVIQKGDIITVI